MSPQDSVSSTRYTSLDTMDALDKVDALLDDARDDHHDAFCLIHKKHIRKVSVLYDHLHQYYLDYINILAQQDPQEPREIEALEELQKFCIILYEKSTDILTKIKRVDLRDGKCNERDMLEKLLITFRDKYSTNRNLDKYNCKRCKGTGICKRDLHNDKLPNIDCKRCKNTGIA